MNIPRTVFIGVVLTVTAVIVFVIYDNFIAGNAKTKQNIGNSTDIVVVEVDSCEYIVLRGYYKGAITHKHNCRFCLKRCK